MRISLQLSTVAGRATMSGLVLTAKLNDAVGGMSAAIDSMKVQRAVAYPMALHIIQ
jgi:hypothetical protein